MKKIRTIIHTTLTILIISLLAQAAHLPHCATCGKKITRNHRYYTKGNKAYCSKKCLTKSMPHCAICGKPVTNGFTANGKVYCSKKCLKQSWPQCTRCKRHVNQGITLISKDGPFYCLRCAKLPKCSCCGLPNPCKKLKDGRIICEQCLKKSITDEKIAKKIFLEVRKIMKEKLQLSTNHKIKFLFVGTDQIKKCKANYQPGTEYGLFHYQELISQTIRTSKNIFGKVTKTKGGKKVSRFYQIFILNYLSKDQTIEVIAHELAHDWMQENYPHINDLLISEGWAEYIASQVNILYNHAYMNKRMQNNTDKIYGDGYRKIKKIVDTKGIKALLKLFAQKELEGKRKQK